MSDEEYGPVTPCPSSKYHPLPVKEIDTSNNHSPPSPSQHYASTWRITLMKYVPFCIHLSLTLLVATMCLGVLDGRSFNINSRRPQYVEADGSLSRVASYLPLQSDIVTAVSLASTATRVAGGWWAAGYIWRCIFMAMEGGGISLEGLSQVISNRPPVPRHFTRRTHMVTIYITLLTTFAIDYFSAVLTGSVTWEPADRLILGSVPLTGISDSSGFDHLTLLSDYLVKPASRNAVAQEAYTAANFAWVDFQRNFSINISAPSSILRRVIPEAHALPTNSTAANITIPMFIVDDFQWIEDPDLLQFPLLNQPPGLFLLDFSSEFSPFVGSFGGGLLPDGGWGPSTTTLTTPHTVSESRLFAWQPDPAVVYLNGSCQQNYEIDPGTRINLYWADDQSDTSCSAIANVTYRAGVATCLDCSFISPTILEAKAPLSLSLNPDQFTSLALAITPSLAARFLFSGYAIPTNYERTKDLAIDVTSRAYQAAWTALTDWYATEERNTTVKIALPTLRAKIIPWRVYLWAALHLWVLVLGLLLVFIQSYYRHPWVEDTTMAIFWLDTKAVIEPDSQDVDPWQRGTEIRRKGMLVLDDAGEGSRSVKIKRA